MKNIFCSYRMNVYLSLNFTTMTNQTNSSSAATPSALPVSGFEALEGFMMKTFSDEDELLVLETSAGDGESGEAAPEDVNVTLPTGPSKNGEMGDDEVPSVNISEDGDGEGEEDGHGHGGDGEGDGDGEEDGEDENGDEDSDDGDKKQDDKNQDDKNQDAAQKPKFKVGDKVRMKTTGVEKTVMVVNADGTYVLG